MIDFPNAPTEGQLFSAEGTIWQFTDGRWAVVASGDEVDLFVLKSGDTMTGSLRISVPSGGAALLLSDGTGVDRWGFARDAATGDLLLARFSTAGVYQDAPIRIAQANGAVTMPLGLTLGAGVVGTIADFSNGVVFGRDAAQVVRQARDVLYGGNNNMGVLQLLDAGGQSVTELRYWWNSTSSRTELVAVRGADYGNVTDFALTPGFGFNMNMGNQTGAANIVGSWDGTAMHRVSVVSSEASTKRDIRALTLFDGMDVVMKLKPVLYRPASPDETDRVWPGFVVDDAFDAGLHDLIIDNGPELPRGFAYDRVTAYLVAAAQELTARIEQLENAS